MNVTLIAFCRKAVSALQQITIHIGRDPQQVTGPALILLPVLPSTLCCGLAGILALRGKKKPDKPAADLSASFRKVAGKDLTALLDGRTTASKYLGGKPALEAMERELQRMKGEEAFRQLFFSQARTRRLKDLAARMGAFLAAEEMLLDRKAGCFSTVDLEAVNSALVLIRDIHWGLEHDILDNVQRIMTLAGADRIDDVDREAMPKYRKLNSLLNCLDRLEVRGRDSAGIQISFVPADAGAAAEVLAGLRTGELESELRRRSGAGDTVNGSLTVPAAGACGGGESGGPVLTFSYKTASIIGELGRNVRELRASITRDHLLKAFARMPVASETTIAHTRWASVGSITEENCHPLSNFTLPMAAPAAAAHQKHYPAYGTGSWTIHAALNGDIDNYQVLREGIEAGGELIAPEVTTDTKIIPLQIEQYLLSGCDLPESFRRAVGDFEGSHAIAMVCSAEPGKVFLALRGSGQSIYVGIAADRYVFSSELYGLVEETSSFVKMDGEKSSHPDRPEATGQIFVLDQDGPGGVEGIRGLFYDGTPLPLGGKDIRTAEITTRDIDRGGYPHFFLKEITEAIHSVRKTLRGKYRIERDRAGERVVFNLGEDIVPERIREALTGGAIRRIVVTGHGTAAVAGSAVADAIESRLKGSGIRVESRIASELSGFALEKDLRDTLVIPITQSGTTTDTNRAVAMAVERGAAVISVVNRRQSDITTRSDGVFYTSDGRDIEMAVASTKAFYSQIVAGRLLALYLASMLKTLSGERIAMELRRLEETPALMGKVLDRREEIRLAAQKTVGLKRYWAVVGSGPNKVAADEIRIKLSELCYKTISSDVIENKKHIDLSAEPLIIVCAAGNPAAVAGDVVKDVAIFKAHRASVVVFADEGERRFDDLADAVIPLPKAPMPLPVILNTVAGHLFGYYAACAIDQEALFLREFKSRLNLVMVEQARLNMNLYESVTDNRLHRLVNEFAERFNQRRNQGAFGLTSARTIADMVLLLKYAAGKLPLDDFRYDFPAVEGAGSPVDLLDATLGHAVDELSRPIDAIRHQAKTVTVGTSRKEIPLRGPIFDLLAELDFTAESLLSLNILDISRIQRAVAGVNGYTLYAINHLDAEGKPGEEATVAIAGRGGISVGMRSRAEQSERLMGTKKGIVASGRLYVGRGKSDSASLVIIPLLGGDDLIRHLLLVHVGFNEGLSVGERKEILGERVNGIRDLIQEYNLIWDERALRRIPVAVLLGEPVEVIAGMIRENQC